MVRFSIGRLQLMLHTRWGAWLWGIQNNTGVHGYGFWWRVGPFHVKWGEHDDPCELCPSVIEQLNQRQDGWEYSLPPETQ